MSASWAYVPAAPLLARTACGMAPAQASSSGHGGIVKAGPPGTERHQKSTRPLRHLSASGHATTKHRQAAHAGDRPSRRDDRTGPFPDAWGRDQAMIVRGAAASSRPGAGFTRSRPGSQGWLLHRLCLPSPLPAQILMQPRD